MTRSKLFAKQFYMTTYSYAPIRQHKVGLGQKHQINSYYLNRAYRDANGTFVKHNTMYIAGTRRMKDVTQWGLILLGLSQKSDIYKRADQRFKNIILKLNIVSGILLTAPPP